MSTSWYARPLPAKSHLIRGIIFKSRTSESELQFHFFTTIQLCHQILIISSLPAFLLKSIHTRCQQDSGWFLKCHHHSKQCCNGAVAVLNGHKMLTICLQTKPHNLVETKVIRDLNPSDINKLISVSGMITRTSNVIPDLRCAAF